MLDRIAELEGRLFCPDDGTVLVLESKQFCCSHCSRVFRVLREGIIELLPTAVASDTDNLNVEYASDYVKDSKQQLNMEEVATAWGAPESMPEKWVERRNRQVHCVVRLLQERITPSAFVCDVSAGAGYYTFALAERFRTVLHCDLSAENLSYAVWKARKSGVSNIVFVRSDYFAPPFSSSVDASICMDSLIRGAEHERKLLRSIVKATAAHGVALVDFHNWWHNPIRRLGLLPENFGANRSYTRAEVQGLLQDCGITRFDYHPFHQEADAASITGTLVKAVLPATRLMYLIRPEARS